MLLVQAVRRASAEPLARLEGPASAEPPGRLARQAEQGPPAPQEELARQVCGPMMPEALSHGCRPFTDVLKLCLGVHELEISVKGLHGLSSMAYML